MLYSLAKRTQHTNLLSPEKWPVNWSKAKCLLTFAGAVMAGMYLGSITMQALTAFKCAM